MSSWIMAIRPKTLFAGISPVILALAFSHFKLGEVHTTTALITIFTTLLLQVSSNLINDYYDGVSGTDGKARLGPVRVTSAGLIAPHIVKRSFLCTLGASFLLGLYLMKIGGLPIIIIGLLSLLFAWAYTGGPYPLSYLGLGEILAFLFFGPIAVIGTFYLQAHSYHSSLLSIALIPGLMSAAIMAVNNFRDIHTDKASGKTTLAVLLGESKSRFIVPLLYCLSSLSVLLLAMNYQRPLIYLAALIPLLFFPVWKRTLKGPINESLNQVLAKTGLCLFLTCITISAGFLL